MLFAGLCAEGPGQSGVQKERAHQPGLGHFPGYWHVPNLGRPELEPAPLLYWEPKSGDEGPVCS